MWGLLVVPFAVSIFVVLPAVRRFVGKILYRLAPTSVQIELPEIVTRNFPRLNPLAILYSFFLFLSASLLSFTIVTALAFTVIPTGLGFGLIPLLIFASLIPAVFRIKSALSSTPNLSIGRRIALTLSNLFWSIPLSAGLTIVSFFAVGFLFLANPISFIKVTLSFLILPVTLFLFLLDNLLLRLRSLFNVNAKQVMTGDTSLIAATYGADNRRVAHLIQKGAQVNTQNKSGYTALHAVISSVYIPHDKKILIINALLEAGADTQILNIAGQTPISLLNSIPNEEERQALLQLFQARNIDIPAAILRPRSARQFNSYQSYNILSVQKSANRSWKALQTRYTGINIEATLNEIEREFEIQARTLKNPEEKRWVVPARRALQNMLDSRIIYIEHFNDRPSLQLRTALAYVWAGVCDPNALKGKTLTNEEIVNRKKQFIQHLYECQRGYNLNDEGVDNNLPNDHPICGHGHMVKMLSALWHEHDDVVLAFITPNSFTLKAKQVLFEKFKALDKATQDKYLPEWGKTRTIPDPLFERLQPQITAALRAEFDQYADFIDDAHHSGYERILETTVESLQSLPPPLELTPANPKAIASVLKEVGKEAGVLPTPVVVPILDTEGPSEEEIAPRRMVRAY